MATDGWYRLTNMENIRYDVLWQNEIPAFTKDEVVEELKKWDMMYSWMASPTAWKISDLMMSG